MNANKLLTQLWLLVFCFTSVQGQIHFKDKPYSFKHALPKRFVEQKIMPSIDTFKLSIEDKNEAKKEYLLVLDILSR